MKRKRGWFGTGTVLLISFVWLISAFAITNLDSSASSKRDLILREATLSERASPGLDNRVRQGKKVTGLGLTPVAKQPNHLCDLQDSFCCDAEQQDPNREDDCCCGQRAPTGASLGDQSGRSSGGGGPPNAAQAESGGQGRWGSFPSTGLSVSTTAGGGGSSGGSGGGGGAGGGGGGGGGSPHVRGAPAPVLGTGITPLLIFFGFWFRFGKRRTKDILNHWNKR